MEQGQSGKSAVNGKVEAGAEGREGRSQEGRGGAGLGFRVSVNTANRLLPRPHPPSGGLLALTRFILTTQVGLSHYPAHAMGEETQEQEA